MRQLGRWQRLAPDRAAHRLDADDGEVVAAGRSLHERVERTGLFPAGRVIGEARRHRHGEAEPRVLEELRAGVRRAEHTRDEGEQRGGPPFASHPPGAHGGEHRLTAAREAPPAGQPSGARSPLSDLRRGNIAAMTGSSRAPRGVLVGFGLLLVQAPLKPTSVEPPGGIEAL